MIDRLKKPVKMQDGGIGKLPLPPSSPNVPAVYNQAPLFSLKGLQQRYQGLPGFIRTPLNKTAGLAGGRVLGPIFAGQLIGAGFDQIARATNTPEEYEAMKEKARAQGGFGYFDDVNISQDAPPPKELSNLEKDFPGMSGSEIIDQINKSEQDSGIEINPNEVGEVINQTIEKNQLDGADVKKPDGPNEKKPEIDETDTVIMSDEEIINEIDNRETQKRKAKQFYFENQMDFLNSGDNRKSLLALQLDNAVDDIMGEDKRSNKLLLLQLAANLISGRTDQPGFKGFLDVLGQAGQNVIPMALALEDERRKDETELKKAILANNNKKLSEYSADDKIVKVRFPGKTEYKPFRARTSKEGRVEIKIPDAAEGESAYVDVTNYDYKMLDAPEAKDIERINKSISVKARALRGLNNALELTMNDPQLIGSPGTLQSVFLQAGDILQSYFGKSTYDDISKGNREYKAHLQSEINARVESGELTKEEGEAEMASVNAEGGFFDRLADQMNIMSDKKSSTTLQQQAALKATELLTSYALANILKDKDRLAVRDIERAEKLTNQFGLFKSPTAVISQYLVIKKELEQSIQDDLKVAESIGILTDDIANYDAIADLSKVKIGQQNKQFEDNITKIIEANPDELSKVADVLFGNIKIVGETE
tara:strand:+ start:10055 stop:12010 length:1956 start_codon:yes stop_codon:yes gene_type:complete